MLTGIISYGFAAFVFLALCVLLTMSRQNTVVSRVLIFASFMSFVWALGSAGLILKPTYLWAGSGVLDSLRVFSWGLFLVVLLNNASVDSNLTNSNQVVPKSHKHYSQNLFLALAFAVIALQLLLIAFSALQISKTESNNLSNNFSLLIILWMIAPLASLYLVEQLYVSTLTTRRKSGSYLCVGLAAMFLFDFALYTDSLLFKHIRLDLWQARGVLYAFLVPLVALTVVRNPSWSIDLHVSRKAVTTSVTLLGAGIYLLATAFAASLIRLGQFEGASVILVTIVVLALVALTLMLLSKKFRAKIRVSISKHFFNFKYDYRTEWLKFTRTLASDEEGTPDAIVKGLCNIIDSEEGVLWGKDKNGKYVVTASVGELYKQYNTNLNLNSLEVFLEKSGWIIDLQEYKDTPNNYVDLTLPDSITQNEDAWLIIPLPFQDHIEGYVLVGKSTVLKNINWEDRDLLKTAGQQAASLLAQRRVHQELKEASQFEAYSKLSAYIVHDLKNILGQQSLIVSNAQKHKHKPEFVDDVIDTIENSVTRMQALLKQLREPTQETPNKSLDIIDVLGRVIASRQSMKPTPTMRNQSAAQLVVDAVEDKLFRVFSHLLQNAQEATEQDGLISVEVSAKQNTAFINVTDTGKGMSQEFIANKLFTAFESTKGLTGMGIGVFESREYIRSLGGDIDVVSEIGKGSKFTIKLPLASVTMD